jgi:hypothetical protein
LNNRLFNMTETKTGLFAQNAICKGKNRVGNTAPIQIVT